MRHDTGKGKGDGPMVRKDPNNKVCTSKGMKDRRIRLSANTAIQFYDIQDRLGFDRPTKAIDWLMKEAKVAIDALDSDHLQEYPLPSFTTSIFNPSEAFHPTPCNQNETNWNHDRTSSFFNNQPFGLINRYQTEGEQNPVIVPQETNHFSAPFDFTWNPNYNTGEGFASVLREPLQSSLLHPVGLTSDNEFTNDNGLMGFSFQQEIHIQEDQD